MKCLSAVEKKYEKGDAVFLAGTEIHSMGFVLSGSVEISRDDFWGNRQVLGHAGSGELFGEAYACMPGEALMVNVEAAEKSRILFLNVRKILNVCTPACSHHNRLIHNLLYIMAKKNLMLTRKIDHMGQRSIREKVMAYLSFESERQKKADVYDPLQPSAARRLPCGGQERLVCGTLQDEKGRADLNLRRTVFTLL